MTEMAAAAAAIADVKSKSKTNHANDIVQIFSLLVKFQTLAEEECLRQVCQMIHKVPRIRVREEQRKCLMTNYLLNIDDARLCRIKSKHWYKRIHKAKRWVTIFKSAGLDNNGYLVLPK